MRKFLITLVAITALAGCQHQESQQTNNADQRRDIGHKLILKSFNDLQNKDLKSAIVDLETSIKINPDEPQAYLLLGQILIKLQQFDQASGFLTMTGKTFPNDGTVFYMLAVANKLDNKKMDAVMAARHSVEIFQAQNDRDNMLKSASLLHDLVNEMPDKAVADTAAQAANSTNPAAQDNTAGQSTPEAAAAAGQLPANGND